MLIDQKYYIVQPFQPQLDFSFREYLDEARENLVVMLRDTAQRRWDALRSRMAGASDANVGAALHRWWKRQFREFRERLLGEYEYDRLERRNRREGCRRIRAEDQLQATQDQLAATQEELFRVKEDLKLEQGLVAQLKEQWRCRNCNAEWWC